MPQRSHRFQLLGYALLVVAFVAAGSVFATTGWRAFAEEGLLAMPTIVSLLAVLGVISLTHRYARVALESARQEARARRRR